jgi:two-component SAPR family response regulator
MYFLICESCFWCASSSNLHFIKNPKCPDNVRVSINSYQTSITNARFQVSAFTDSAIALEYFEVNYNSCNLIISDTMMPGMNGYEFVKKAKEIDKQVKVVLMSAFKINDKEFHNVLPNIKVDAIFHGKVK